VEEEESSSSGSDVESSSDNESDDASDDETDDDRKLPATSMPPRKLKSPPVKSPPSKAKPISQRKKDPSEGDVGALANALKGIIITQKDGTIGIIDVTQAYDYVVFVAKCERNVNYAHVRLQLPSDITSKMITCKVADDGLSVLVTVRKPIDCALIDPMFAVMKYHEQGGIDQNHPIVVSLASLRRSRIESKKEEYTEKVVTSGCHSFATGAGSTTQQASEATTRLASALGFILSPSRNILMVSQSPKGPHTLTPTFSRSPARNSMRRR
jgi:hypothetical protein